MVYKYIPLRRSLDSKKLKYSEFHRKIVKNGWKFSHAEGSHYFYTKDGILSCPVPYHGSKEFYEPLRIKIAKDMGLK